MSARLVRDLGVDAIAAALAREGLRFAFGPFIVEARSDAPGFAAMFAAQYGDLPLSREPIADFAVALARIVHPFGFVTSRLEFRLNGRVLPMQTIPASADRLFAAGLARAIESEAHGHAVLRAAAWERGGFGLILFGDEEGAAALAARGWKSLGASPSLLRLADGALMPLPLPNLRDATPISSPASTETPQTRWLVFAEASAQNEAAPNDAALEPLPKARALFALASATRNRRALGAEGFARLVRVVDTAGCYRLRYRRAETIGDALQPLGRAPVASVA